MSRLANVPISVPSGVTISLEKAEGLQTVTITNGKVTESWTVYKAVNVSLEDSLLSFNMSESDRQDKHSRAMLGTDFRHVKCLIEGMATPFETVLEIHGLGYRAKLQGKQLVLSLGKSHDDIVDIPEHVVVEMKGEKEASCKSHSKKILGDFVAQVCSKRKPDAYKAKGVRIKGRHYRTKQDK